MKYVLGYPSASDVLLRSEVIGGLASAAEKGGFAAVALRPAHPRCEPMRQEGRSTFCDVLL